MVANGLLQAELNDLAAATAGSGPAASHTVAYRALRAMVAKRSPTRTVIGVGAEGWRPILTVTVIAFRLPSLTLAHQRFSRLICS